MEKVIILALLAGWVMFGQTEKVRVEPMTPDEVKTRAQALEALKKQQTALEEAQAALKATDEKIAVAHGTTTGYKPDSGWTLVSDAVFHCADFMDTVEIRGGYLIITTVPTGQSCPSILHGSGTK